jgi:hypothetical protein
MSFAQSGTINLGIETEGLRITPGLCCLPETLCFQYYAGKFFGIKNLGINV